MCLLLRDATVADARLIAGFVRDLATYEKLAHEVTSSADDFAASMDFGHFAALIAEWDGEPVGFALWYRTYSTFSGRPGLYLEDLFVRPDHRGHGIGRAIFQDLARRTLAQGCARLEWSVLDWNQPAIDFYRAMGATPGTEWTKNALDMAALAALSA